MLETPQPPGTGPVPGPDAAMTVRHQLETAEEAARAAGVIRKNFPDLLPAETHLSEGA